MQDQCRCEAGRLGAWRFWRTGGAGNRERKRACGSSASPVSPIALLQGLECSTVCYRHRPATATCSRLPKKGQKTEPTICSQEVRKEKKRRWPSCAHFTTIRRHNQMSNLAGSC
ncbi:hypothetical protein Mapa_003081 [Marchantia paleacea]|nr:hypothetical protein Mapa_003081 [Marchantia paleacea]